MKHIFHSLSFLPPPIPRPHEFGATKVVCWSTTSITTTVLHIESVVPSVQQPCFNESTNHRRNVDGGEVNGYCVVVCSNSAHVVGFWAGKVRDWMGISREMQHVTALISDLTANASTRSIIVHGGLSTRSPFINNPLPSPGTGSFRHLQPITTTPSS